MQKRWCSLEWSANLFSGFTNFRNKSFWWKWWGAICIVISTKVKIQYLWTRTFVNISDLCWPLEQHKIKRWLICWKDLIVLKRQYKTKFCISQSVTPVKYSRKLLLILFCFCFLAKACQSERTGTAHTWLKCSHWYPTIWSLSSLPLFFTLLWIKIPGQMCHSVFMSILNESSVLKFDAQSSAQVQLNVGISCLHVAHKSDVNNNLNRRATRNAQ